MQLGRYQILKQLATGDVADVHLARATGMEGFARHVVIKCIRGELAREDQLVESFLEEARIAAALHHHNIVQVHDIGEQDGSYFFAMEYVHGEDVSKLLAKVRDRGEQVPLEHVVAIISATAAGLHHAHEQRSPAGEHLDLVHRDVCPANILLGYDGSVKLVDFGMAKAALRSNKTASGTLRGKASYMSPEQCVGRAIDRRTDTFALGVVLYELATAQRLFKGANEFFTMASIVDGVGPPPSAARPDLPKTLDDIVVRALAKAPEARFQTAEDLREALERFAVEHELRTSNKALADYMIALFGQRPEPWHSEAEPPAPVKDFDGTTGFGLVKIPENEADLIARHAPRKTAPIMLAQSIAEVEAETAAAEAARSEVDDGWDDNEPPTTSLQAEELPVVAAARPAAADARNPDHEETRNERRPSAPVAAQPIPAAAQAPTVVAQPIPVPPPDDDPFGATVVAPPVFVDEPSLTGAGEVTREIPDDEGAITLEGVEPHVRPTRAATPLPLPPGDPPSYVGPPIDTQPRPSSEHMYIGPPAPPVGRAALVQTFFATYRRSILVGAGSGVLFLLLAALTVRACSG